jgi:hypothetical protein
LFGRVMPAEGKRARCFQQENVVLVMLEITTPGPTDFAGTLSN